MSRLDGSRLKYGRYPGRRSGHFWPIWHGLESLEPRVMMSATPIQQGVPGEVVAAAGEQAEPLLADLFPWINPSLRFFHDPTFDSTSIAGQTQMRFTTATANIGTGPMKLRAEPSDAEGNQEVYQRIFDTDGGFTEQLAGVFSFNDPEWFFRFGYYAEHNLREVTENDGVGDIVAQNFKHSFCLVDTIPFDLNLPGATRLRVHNSCLALQGISVGWTDVYRDNLKDQFVNVSAVRSGTYWLEVKLDPLNQLVEANDDNNTAQVLVEIPPNGAKIWGEVFNDRNGDSAFAGEGGEPPLEGWTVFLDDNGNGEMDEDERHTATNETGQYAFSSLEPGTYTVAQVFESGWESTIPGNAAHELTLGSDEIAEGVIFGNKLIFPGDLDGDLLVDINDLAALLNHFGDTVGLYGLGDISGLNGVPDGLIDINDLALILNHFNERAPTAGTDAASPTTAPAPQNGEQSAQLARWHGWNHTRSHAALPVLETDEQTDW